MSTSKSLHKPQLSTSIAYSCRVYDRGLRVPVATVVSMVADGMTTDEICADLPDLAPDDVAEALRYAAETVREGAIPLRRPA